MSKLIQDISTIAKRSTTGLPMVGPFFEGPITSDILDALYPLLTYEFPEDCIERTKKEKTHKAYDTTGVGYQYVVNRFNEVLGISHWRFIPIEKEVERGCFGGDAKKPNVSITVEVTVEIGNWVDGQFHPIAQATLAGGHTSASFADALKGSITNGVKKAGALLGPGWGVYAGEIDDDNTPIDRSKTQIQGGNRQGNQGNDQQGAIQQGNGQSGNRPVNQSGGQPANQQGTQGQRSSNNSGTPAAGSNASQGGASVVPLEVILTPDGVPTLTNPKVAGKPTPKAVTTIVIIAEDQPAQLIGWEDMANVVMGLSPGDVLKLTKYTRKESTQYGIQLSVKDFEVLSSSAGAA